MCRPTYFEVTEARTPWMHPDDLVHTDADGISHTPGWPLDALRHLLVERSVTAIGHETVDADPGMWTTAAAPDTVSSPESARRRYACAAYVLDHDRYQAVLLTNLHTLPPTGAHIVVGVGKARHGTALPTRVLALLP
ncbi:hypothetical protein [Streptomyces chrestomyceticus]|uniref:hypothetical protein n=1 Tax=Streptomyces chrestomyceticus TaxID=68185 RepID=UPI000AA3EAE3